MNKLIFSILILLISNPTVFSRIPETSNSRAESAADSASVEGFSVSGSVAAKSTKSLLSQAVIKFQKYTTNPIELMKNQIQTIKTDENGRWSFKNLSAGEYKIIVIPPGSNDKTAESGAQPKLAQVTKIIKITGSDIRDLIIELPVESTISGTITLKGDDQNPDSPYIIATDEKQAIVSGAPITDKNFRIENLSEGDFFLNISADDYYIQSIKLGNEDVTNSAINLKDGQNIKSVQIVMANDVGMVKGKINGFKPDSVTLIVLLPYRYTVQNVLRSSLPESADENGEFEMKAPPGEYFITTVTPNDLARRDRNNLEKWFKEITENAQKVVISSSQIITVELNPSN